MLIAKEKEKGLFEKKTQEAAGHNSEPPQKKYTIVDQGCSWTTPLKICLGDVFLFGF